MRVLINFIIRFHSVIFRKFYLIASNMEETINQFQFESNEKRFPNAFCNEVTKHYRNLLLHWFPVAVSEKCDENPFENAVR